jgi:hypothetical protein
MELRGARGRWLTEHSLRATTATLLLNPGVEPEKGRPYLRIGIAAVVLLGLLASHGCGLARRETADIATPPSKGDEGAWLKGSVDDRFAQVAKHLRGFDVAMAETGYRYVELYWAGTEGNWRYAEYQLAKIRTAIANGVERRPRRAQSARMLDGALEEVSQAVGKRDRGAFASAFGTLTATCNACHQAEGVAFMTVRVPTHPLSPVDFSSSHNGSDDPGKAAP